MSTKYRFRDNAMPHFITLTLVEWIDLFSREKYKQLIVDNLQYCMKHKGLIIYAYVIMTNHIHLICSTTGDQDLSILIRDFKRYMAKLIYRELQVDYRESRRRWLIAIIERQGQLSRSNKLIKVWRDENHPVMLETNAMQDQRLDYIHENPVRAGICYTPEGYKYSSAGVYCGEVGVLEVILLG